MTIDHPLVRASTRCPICHEPKDKGLVMCWPCYRQIDMRNGNPLVDDLLDAAEKQLEEAT